MELSPQVRKALGLYGPVVQAAVNDRLNVRDTYAMLNDAAAEAGLSSLGVPASAISSLRGIYARMRTAAENLAAANPEEPVSGNMIGQAPWSPDLQVQAATPAYLATFRLATVGEDGEVSERWITTRITGEIGTVGDLQAMVGADAAGAAAGYGEQFVGWDALSVVAGL